MLPVRVRGFFKPVYRAQLFLKPSVIPTTPSVHSPPARRRAPRQPGGAGAGAELTQLIG